MYDILCMLFLLIALASSSNANFDPTMDNVLFNIHWPGPLQGQIQDIPSSEEPSEDTIVVTTKDNEKYQCVLPDTASNDATLGEGGEYVGPSAMELLTPLFEQTSCSYKIEVYWTYELCHGKFLRQYHEEKEIGKEKMKLQEYFLGRYNRRTAELKKEQAGDQKETTDSEMLLQKVDGVEIPYHEVLYTDGTPCDLTGQPRSAKVRYVCQQDGRGEMYSLKEVSTCHYEVVVLTAVLCDHPRYQQKKDPVNKILCHSLDGSPRRPKSLDQLELQNTQGRYNRREGIQEQLLPKKDIPPSLAPKHPHPESPRPGIGALTDQQIITEFLRGDYCIQGGSGWWKHEFCYGKSVTQYHEDSSGKTVILLGGWNEEIHTQWIQKNVKKRPESLGKQNKVVLHYYGGGDVCELTNKPRSVEVKLKCKENPSQPHSVAIYLIEPKPCEYSLVVESPILCPVLQQADENGIIKYKEK